MVLLVGVPALDVPMLGADQPRHRLAWVMGVLPPEHVGLEVEEQTRRGLHERIDELGEQHRNRGDDDQKLSAVGLPVDGRQRPRIALDSRRVSATPASSLRSGRSSPLVVPRLTIPRCDLEVLGVAPVRPFRTPLLFPCDTARKFVTAKGEQHDEFDQHRACARVRCGMGRCSTPQPDRIGTASMWGNAAKRPGLFVSVVAFLALVIVRSTRRAVDDQGITHRLWPEFVLLLALAYTVAIFAFLTSERGQRSMRKGPGDPRIFILLIALAESPVVIAVAMVFLGTAAWALWASFATTCVLLVWSWRYARVHVP